MENYGIEMKGIFLHQKVATLPAWGASDEGRMIYALDTAKISMGNASAWETFKSDLSPAFIDDDSVTGTLNTLNIIENLTAPRIFTLPNSTTIGDKIIVILDGSITDTNTLTITNINVANTINGEIGGIAYGETVLYTISEYISIATGAGTTEWVTNGVGSISTVPGKYIFLSYEPSAQQLLDNRILEGNGGSILDIDYPDILTNWGSKMYGNVDGTHFNLPALGGYTPRFFDNGAGIDPDASGRTDRGDGTVGDEVGTLQLDEIKSHLHSITRLFQSTAGGNDFRSGNSVGTQNTESTANTGGNETRTKNIYVWGGIYY